MHEISAYIDQDVGRKLIATCDISRVDVGNQFARFDERQRNLEQGIESVTNAVDNRMVENDRRNNAQGRMLGGNNHNAFRFKCEDGTEYKRYPTNPR